MKTEKEIKNKVRLFSDRKGQTALTVLIGLLIIGLIYFAGLSIMVASLGATYVEANNITGLDGFFYSNINLVITVFYIIALIVVGRASF